MPYRTRDGRLVPESEACINGVVKDGYAVHFDIMMMDSARPAMKDQAFKDACLQFYDSAEGKHVLAQARAAHAITQRSRGAAALPFTDADALEVIRTAVKARAASDAQVASYDAALPALQQKESQAYAAYAARLSNPRR